MGVKLFSRNQIIINLAIFIALSIFYYHTIHSIGQGISAVNMNLLYDRVVTEPLMIGFSLILLFQVTRASAMSRYFFPIFIIIVSYKNFSAFFSHFDKVVLSLSFVYIIIAFYLYILWLLEMNSAAYRPRYKTNDIDQRSLISLGVEIFDENSKQFFGILTNWDADSCFILLDCDQVIGSVRGNVEVKVKFDNLVFSQTGKVVAGYGYGIGVRFVNDNSDLFIANWTNFYGILSDRGYIL